MLLSDKDKIEAIDEIEPAYVRRFASGDFIADWYRLDGGYLWLYEIADQDITASVHICSTGGKVLTIEVQELLLEIAHGHGYEKLLAEHPLPDQVRDWCEVNGWTRTSEGYELWVV
jgi:hypothetical protein